MKSLLATCGLLAAVTLAAPVMAETPRTAAPAGAAVYFIEPANGATVSGPVNVRFGLPFCFLPSTAARCRGGDTSR
jgi:hypothetical protein